MLSPCTRVSENGGMSGIGFTISINLVQLDEMWVLCLIFGSQQHMKPSQHLSVLCVEPCVLPPCTAGARLPPHSRGSHVRAATAPEKDLQARPLLDS